MMIVKGHNEGKDNEFDNLQFDTEMSAEGHPQDNKQFSPWASRQNNRMNNFWCNKQEQEVNINHINYKHKMKIKQLSLKSAAKKNVEERINSEKMTKEDYLELIGQVKRKSYFEDKPKFNHFHKKPKNIQIRLQQNILLPHAQKVEPQKTQPEKKQKKKENLPKKQFLEAIKICNKSTANKFYNTLELNVYPSSQRKKLSHYERFQYSSLTARKRRYLDQLEYQNDKNDSFMACQGTNLLSSSKSKLRREKLRQKLQQITKKEDLFVQ